MLSNQEKIEFCNHHIILTANNIMEVLGTF